jgi:hypothetical protein
MAREDIRDLLVRVEVSVDASGGRELRDGHPLELDPVEASTSAAEV